MLNMKSCAFFLTFTIVSVLYLRGVFAVTGTVTATAPLTIGNYKIYSSFGSSNSWANVQIKGLDGTSIDNLIIHQGDTETSFATGLTIKVLSVQTLQDGTVLGVNLDVSCVPGTLCASVTATNPLTVGDLSLYSSFASNDAWARVDIKAPDGTLLDNLIIHQGDTRTSSITGLTIKVLNAHALQDGTVMDVGLSVNPQYCYDSDGGANYNVKGYVDSSMAPGKTWDVCIDNTLLLEYDCNPSIGGADLGTNYVCPYGCSDGACLLSSSCTPNWQCSDWSSCSYGTQTRVCTDSNNCGTSSGKPITFQTCAIQCGSQDQQCCTGNVCSSGLTCQNGTCQPHIGSNTTCTDSDGGKNYYVKGTARGIDGNIQTDYCTYERGIGTDPNGLMEFWCNPTTQTLNSEIYSCPYGCRDGACLSQPQCVNHNDCSQACDNLGINSHWMGAGSTYTDVVIKASDPSDPYLRDWNIFTIDPSGTYQGGGVWGNGAPIKTSNFYSGSTWSISLSQGTYYLVIGQSGGASLGTYAGNLIINGVTVPFSNADVNHAIQFTVSYKSWNGTCPSGVYGCMTGQCCLGQCPSNGTCYCQHTNFVDIYGSVCPSGQTCGSDCYCHQSVPINNTCSNGTLYGNCSATKPLYCDNGSLVNKCSWCGCPLNQNCNNTAETCYIPIQTCIDGTLYGRCSSMQPQYCDNGNLINRCSQCGCPSSYDCQSDGNCSISQSNQKNMSKYTDKTVFLISDENWRDVLSLVPVAVWTNNDSSVSKYPMLIYHEEDAPILSISGPEPLKEAPFKYFVDGDWQSFRSEGNFISRIVVNSGSGNPGVTYYLQLQYSNGNVIANSQEITTDDYFQSSSFVFNVPVIKGESYKLVWKINDGKGVVEVISYNTYPYGEYSGNPDYDVRMNIYGETSTNKSFDVDSTIYFMQQYKPDKVKIIGETPQELDNLLITEPELGAGININNIERISVDDYLSYWKSFKDVVYVEDNYELALLASTYASLINAPLIINGTNLDTSNVFSGKSVICVGSVTPIGTTCDEQYNLEQLQRKYLDLTNTDKIILINSNDLSINETGSFSPDKSSNPISELYSKDSMAAPILASAKHEVIFSVQSTDYQEIDTSFKSRLNNYYDLNSINDLTNIYLTIMSSPNAIPYRKYEPAVPDVRAWDTYRALDQTQYGDIDGDFVPDLSVGRIMGITIADVSSYLARDIFYDNLGKTNNMKFLANPSTCNQTALWSNNFTSIGYNSTSKIGVDFDSSDWLNQDLIYWQDHGDSSWAGIDSKDIPLLSNSIVFNDACLTCASYDENSFCNIAIRQGALAHLGAVGTGWTSNNIYMATINGIYYNNFTLGKSFSKGYKFQSQFYINNFLHWMTTLLGDPTIQINPSYFLKSPLESGFC